MESFFSLFDLKEILNFLPFAKDVCENNNQILISKFPVKGMIKNGKEKFIVQL